MAGFRVIPYEPYYAITVIKNGRKKVGTSTVLIYIYKVKKRTLGWVGELIAALINEN